MKISLEAIGFAVIGIALVFPLTGCNTLPSPEQSTPSGSALAPHLSSAREELSPVIAAAGDIACAPTQQSFEREASTGQTCQMAATAALIGQLNPTAVLPLGDLQYNRGELAKFQQSYAPTWGRYKAITRPVVGNHEYGTANAAGYFRYFGAVAGDPDKGYYSYDLGNWHIIALNSNCNEVGGCGENSPQVRWLKADLANYPATCTLAYWHHPRFSSGEHGNNAELDVFWKLLYAAGVEVVLNGHDHTYERFAPQTPDAQPDPERGIRQFVVGTGGRSHYSFNRVRANSEVRNEDTYGILALTLQDAGYEWKFMPVAGKSFTDVGRDRCH